MPGGEKQLESHARSRVYGSFWETFESHMTYLHHLSPTKPFIKMMALILGVLPEENRGPQFFQSFTQGVDHVASPASPFVRLDCPGEPQPLHLAHSPAEDRSRLDLCKLGPQDRKHQLLPSL